MKVLQEAALPAGRGSDSSLCKRLLLDSSNHGCGVLLVPCRNGHSTLVSELREVNEASATCRFLYDQDCGFCQLSVSFARDRVQSRVIFTPWQDFDLSGVGLTLAQANAQAWLLLPDGRAWAGGDAIAGVLLRGCPWARVLGFLMLLPGVRTLNRAVYRLVAAHRHRFPGGTAACTIVTQCKT